MITSRIGPNYIYSLTLSCQKLRTEERQYSATKALYKVSGFDKKRRWKKWGGRGQQTWVVIWSEEICPSASSSQFSHDALFYLIITITGLTFKY